MKNLVMVTLITIIAAIGAVGQTTEFTYQGSLKDGANPANGNYDLEFRLFDASTGGSQHPTIVTRTNVAVTNGTFDVTLDFFSPLVGAFPGADRYLEIRVRNAGGASFTLLTPRQKLGSTPYAQKSINSETANNATSLGGVAANQYLTTTSAGTSFIQNSTAVQANSNFNISGNGTIGGVLSAGSLRTSTNFSIGATPVLSIAGTNNVFVGALTGDANSTGSNNSFFGRSAGTQNATGSSNSFFGSSAGSSNINGANNSFYGHNAGVNSTYDEGSFFGSYAGEANTSGYRNSFFGVSAGRSNTLGDFNSFFGAWAGRSNTVGIYNSFYGVYAGKSNTNGSTNSFFGMNAGLDNTSGNNNSFFGYLAGDSNTLGSDNAFFGRSAGTSNTTGGNNTLIGNNTDVGSGNLIFATAIGSDAVASLSNSIYLGRSGGQDAVRIPGATIMDGSLVIGTLGSAGSQSVCLNAANRISPCSSSLKYKTNISRFGFGLSLIKQLRPITFDWKDGGMHDLGLGAEDVAAIEPLLVTYNKEGKVEGVKYDRIGVVLVNAVKEQQGQIETLKKQIEILTDLVCATNTNADICKEK